MARMRPIKYSQPVPTKQITLRSEPWKRSQGTFHTLKNIFRIYSSFHQKWEYFAEMSIFCHVCNSWQKRSGHFSTIHHKDWNRWAFHTENFAQFGYTGSVARRNILNQSFYRQILTYDKKNSGFLVIRKGPSSQTPKIANKNFILWKI